MIIVAGTVDIVETELKQATELALTMQSATRQEAGCMVYHFSQDLANPTTFHVFEVWETQGALEAHFKTEHMQTFNRALPKVLASKPEVTRYDVHSKAPF